MRLGTIWSLPTLPLKDRLSRTRDWANMATAARLPKRLRYWVTMLELSKATRTSSNVPATPLDEVLANLDGGPR